MKVINVHASLLPKWRGPAPIQWSILSGDKITGVSVILLNKKIDSGNIIYSIKCPINKKDTTLTLTAKLLPISLQTMYQSLYLLTSKKKYIGKFQDEKKSSYSKKITKKDGLIIWSKNVEELDKLIRAFNPWPYSFFFYEKKMIKIIKASIFDTKKKSFKIGEIIKTNKDGIFVNTKKGILKIEIIQISGKKKCHINQIINSYSKWFKPNSILK